MIEETRATAGERRLQLLRELSEQSSSARSRDEVCTKAFQILERAKSEIPFALLYLASNEQASLRHAYGLARDSTACPERLDLADSGDDPWPLARVMGSGHSEVVSGLRRRFGSATRGVDAADCAMLLPLTRSGQGRPYGVLIIGLSSLEDCNAECRSFLDLVASQIAMAIGNAQANEDEKRRAKELRELDRLKTELLARDRAAHAYVDAVLEGAPVGIAFLDRELKFVRINEALAKMDGVPREAHLGRSVCEVLPAVGPELEAIFRKVLLTGERLANQEVSFRKKRAGGIVRHWLASYYPVRVEDEIVGLAAIATEITERKRGERALDFLAKTGAFVTSSLDQKATVEAMTQLVVPSFADWCSVYIREDREPVRLAAITHRDPAKAELVRRLFDAYQGKETAEHGFPLVLRTGKAEFIAKVPRDLLRRMPETDEQRRLVAELAPTSLMTLPLIVHGRTIGAISFVRTDRKNRFVDSDFHLGEELARRVAVAIENARLFELAQRERQRVEEANRAKDEFLAVVSHELRTPLNAMLGWTRMLRSGNLPPDRQAKALETVERNALSQTQLIEDLLDVSRIITGKLRLSVGPVDPTRVAEAALEVVRPAADARGVELIARLDRNSGPIMGDADRLQQVIWNLLTNAVKFTGRGGRVELVTRRLDSHFEIIVSDTGKGISPEFLPHVFERFRQEEAGSRRKHGGLGLGLAIVRHLVEGHGGKIEVFSDGEDMGATFLVALPTRPPAATASVIPAIAPSTRPLAVPGFQAGADLEGLRILVVDDEPDARDLIGSILESCGATVVAAANADRAIQLIKDTHPDVLVSDIGMPGNDGYALIEQLRSFPPSEGGKTPAIALTAYARMEDRTRALLAGFNMHVAKPIEPSELVVVLANVTGRIPGG